MRNPLWVFPTQGLAWKFALIGFATFWIGEASFSLALGFLRGSVIGADVDSSTLATLLPIMRACGYAAEELLRGLLFQNAAPAATGVGTRLALMVQGVIMGLLDLPVGWMRGRPAWPCIVFVPAGIALFHFVRTRLAGAPHSSDPHFSPNAQ